jgi:hypothetical protein
MGNDEGLGHVPGGNAQDTSSLLGSVLRLDVDSENSYAIPTDNPFVGSQEAREEIFAYGFRNPYHLSFDSAGNGDLFVADAGQDRYEEVSRVESGGNYGWRIKEGTHCFDPESPSNAPSTCPSEGADGQPLIDPVIEYSRLEVLGSVVIGGYMYRGSAIPELQGQYIFGDYSRNRVEPDGVLFAARPTDEGLWDLTELPAELSNENDGDGQLERFVLSFGEDEDNEIYVGLIELGGPGGSTGSVYRIASLAEGTEPPAAEDDNGGVPVWIWILVAVAVIGGGVLIARRQSIRLRSTGIE